MAPAGTTRSSSSRASPSCATTSATSSWARSPATSSTTSTATATSATARPGIDGGTISLWNDWTTATTVNSGDTEDDPRSRPRRGAGQGRLLRVHRPDRRALLRGAGGLRRRLGPDEADQRRADRHLRRRGTTRSSWIGLLRAATTTSATSSWTSLLGSKFDDVNGDGPGRPAPSRKSTA